jgi:hypothetical protein
MFIEIEHSAGTSTINLNAIIVYRVSTINILFTQLDGTVLTLAFADADTASQNYKKLNNFISAPNLDYLYS